MARRVGPPAVGAIGSKVVGVIPLPRPWVLASAMLVGVAVGIVAAIGASLLIDARVRPDVVIAVVLGVPTVLGLATMLFAGRRWLTAAGAFVVAIAPGWFATLAAIEVVSSG